MMSNVYIHCVVIVIGHTLYLLVVIVDIRNNKMIGILLTGTIVLKMGLLDSKFFIVFYYRSNMDVSNDSIEKSWT